MKIAVDARELRDKPTGVGRFLAEVLAAWKRMPEAREHEVILCAPEHGGGGVWWEQVELPRRLRSVSADVLFAPGYSGPIGCPIPMVVAIHDVSFAAHPEWFAWREGARRRTLVRLAARQAARVVTISEFSKREIAAHFGIDPSKIVVAYPGVTSFDADLDSAGRSLHGQGATMSEQRRAPANGRMALYVGSIFQRRHVPEVIAGFARLARARPDARLAIVGENRTWPHLDLAAMVASSGVDDRIHLTSYVSEEDLRRQYACSSAFVFLSEYEGFGLTPLEALAMGLPVLLLDTPVAREVCGAAATYVHRPDPSLIEQGLEAVLFDPTERQRILDASAAVLARYSWTTCARRVLEALIESAAA